MVEEASGSLTDEQAGRTAIATKEARDAMSREQRGACRSFLT